MNENTSSICGWFKPFHPRGIQVTLPLPAEPAQAFAAVTAALDAGWLVTAPGLDEGEEKEMVAYVLQGSYERDGETTPFVVLYADGDNRTWPFLKVYLNKKSDVEAFEYASKMILDNLPEYVGNDKPQRGASAKTDRFIVPAPKHFGVVFKKNPKHDPNTEEGKMKPSRLFVRWVDQRPPTQPPAQPNAPQAGPRPTGPQPNGKPNPTTIAALIEYLDDADTKCAAAKLCNRGDLKTCVLTRMNLRGFGSDPAKWQLSVIDPAMLAAKVVAWECRAVQCTTVEALQALAHKVPDDVWAAMGDFFPKLEAKLQPTDLGTIKRDDASAIDPNDVPW